MLIVVEGCQSGRSCHLGKVVYRKVPQVQILSPLPNVVVNVSKDLLTIFLANILFNGFVKTFSFEDNCAD